MPIEIHEVDVLPRATAPAPRPTPGAPPPPPPTERGEDLRTWHRELAGRAARLRAD
jgi:hypothetical protein